MLGSRGMVALGAILLAGIAFFVLMRGGGVNSQNAAAVYAPSQVQQVQQVQGVQAMKAPGPIARELPAESAPALDDIDAKSRAKLRDILREAGKE